MTQSDFESWLRTFFTVTGEYTEGRHLLIDSTHPAAFRLTTQQGWQLVGHLCHLLTNGGGLQTVSPVTGSALSQPLALPQPRAGGTRPIPRTRSPNSAVDIGD
jgi:hypothetical protein